MESIVNTPPEGPLIPWIIYIRSSRSQMAPILLVLPVALLQNTPGGQYLVPRSMKTTLHLSSMHLFSMLWTGSTHVWTWSNSQSLTSLSMMSFLRATLDQKTSESFVHHGRLDIWIINKLILIPDFPLLMTGSNRQLRLPFHVTKFNINLKLRLPASPSLDFSTGHFFRLSKWHSRIQPLNISIFLPFANTRSCHQMHHQNRFILNSMPLRLTSRNTKESCCNCLSLAALLRES